MLDFLRWNKMKVDAAPGTLVYAGEGRDFTPHVAHYSYGPDAFSESQATSGKDISLEPGRVNLLIVTGIHQPKFVKEVGLTLNLPEIYLEDVLNTGQRSKFNWADDDTGFIVMKHMTVDSGIPNYEQVSLFWRENMVVVFLEDGSDLFGGILDRMRKGKGRMRRAGSAYLMTAILDALVDRHMLVLSQLSDTAQELEAKLADKVSDDMLGELYELKRETILLRNALLPVREIFRALFAEDSEIPEDAQPYLQDVAGHQEQTLEGVASLHDILKSMIDYQISLIGIRTNKVMQFLTVIATIFIPLTFIVGVYGMNFRNMPELEWQYGYFVVLGVMVILALGMVWYFAKKKFL